LDKEEGIAMANQVLMSISRDEAERWRIMNEEKYELNRQSELVWERQEGRNEGHAESRKEIAHNALVEEKAFQLKQSKK
jgi:hypothetical protein